MIPDSTILIIIFSLILSALFSGVEIAFISSNKLQIELQNKQGYLSGRILSKFVKNTPRFIGATLIGNTIALVVYGIFMAGLLDPLLELYLPAPFNNDISILLLQTILSTLVVLATAEFLPKSIFLINPNKMVSLFAIPMLFFYYLLLPFVLIIIFLSKVVIKYVLRLEYTEDKIVFRMTDLTNYLKNSTSYDEEDAEQSEVDTKIFNNAVEFKTLKVRDCMIPRTEIVAVDIEDGIEGLRQAFLESGYSKILVYRENKDDILGYCHSRALFKKPKRIEDIITPISIIPETIHANELLIYFIKDHRSMALVVDEFGGTSGIVTIEDVMEEIFGEIQDEHDDEMLIEQQLDDNNFLLSARLEVDYLNEKYDWDLPEGDYDTLGGYVLAINEDIPEVGDIIKAGPFTVTVISKQDARIDTVKLQVNLDYIDNA
jgi:putative hemolysin